MKEDLPQKNRKKNIFFPSGIIFVMTGIGGMIFLPFKFISLFVFILGIILIFVTNLVKKSLKLNSGDRSFPLEKMLFDLKHEIAQTKYLSQLGKLGEMAHSQVVQLESSYLFLMKSLLEKFSPDEITFHRYESAIQEAVLKIQESLKHTSSLITLLNSQTPPSSSSVDEVDSLLKAHEELLIQLVVLTEAIQRINGGEVVHKNFEETIEKLKILAERAQIYSSSSPHSKE